MNKILNTVCQILSKELKRDWHQLANAQLRLIEDLNMVDWQILIAINKLEAHFKIAIPDEEITDINTINRLASAIVKHRSGHLN
jgi:acyl carrier protein